MLFRRRRRLRAWIGWGLAVIVLGTILLRRGHTADPLPQPAVPGTFVLTTRAGGHDRTAHVKIPTGYRSDAMEKPPLILLLHGAGGSGPQMLEHYGWGTLADREKFIAVAPDGLPGTLRLPASFALNPRLWNSGQLKADSPRTKIDDTAYITQLLDELKIKIPYDERRVFVAGHSNGGGMTFRLAAELSERITAVATVAGQFAVEKPQPKRPVPMLYILGSVDPLMPLAGGESKLPWGKRTTPPVAEMLARWADATGRSKEPRTVSDKDGLRRLEYPSRTQGPPLDVLYVEGHGHHWPGAKPALPESMIGPITNKLDATAEIHKFFRACPPLPAK